MIRTVRASSKKQFSTIVTFSLIIVGEREHVVCDGCGLVVDTLTALTRFRVEPGNLKGPLQLCANCSPSGLATYGTRDLEEHLVATLAERPKHSLQFHYKL